MNLRPVSISLGAFALVAATLAPTTSALAADSDIEFSSEAPHILRSNGQTVEFYDRPFDAHLTPTTVELYGYPGQAEGTLTIADVKSGDTLCQATSSSAHDSARPKFVCVIGKELSYGATEVEITVRSADGRHTSLKSYYDAIRPFRDSTMSFESYDKATKTAHVSGKSLAGARFSIHSRFQGQGSGPADATTIGDVTSDGSWTADIHDVEPATLLTFTLPDVAYSNLTHAYVPDEGTLPTPQVSAKLQGDYFNVLVEGTTVGISAIIRNSDGEFVATAGTIPGAESTSVLVPDPRAERTYTVTLEARGISSEPVPFTLRKGEGSAIPLAPTVADAQMSAERVTATIEAAPGGIIRVTDATGAIVAVKLTGATGRAQLAFRPDSGKAAQTYSVAQTVHGSTSAMTPFAPAAG